MTQEQIPMPCTNCGAPMREAPSQPGMFAIACGHCGTSEQLPPELDARITLLRHRLANLASAKARVTGLALRITMLSKNLPRHIGIGLLAGVPLILVVGMQWFSQYLGAATDPSAGAGREAFAEQIYRAVTVLLVVAIILFALVVSALYARFRIRPLLRCYPPTVEGAEPRCRCCGGELPNADDALLDCSWCGAQNIVTEGLARAKAMTADEAARRYGQTADHVAAKLRAAANPLVFYAIFAILILGQGVLAPFVLSMLKESL